MNKLIHTALVFLLLAAGIFTEVNAQIRDDEQSASFLAVQCAVSSGGNAPNYEGYGRKLAKTLGLLTPAQQERIFGYVPQPAVLASIDPVFSGSLGPAAAGTDSGAGTNPTGGNDPAPTSNPLVAAVGKLNDTLSGTAATAEAIIGGTDPNTVEDEEPPAETKPDPKWANSVYAYLRSIGQPELADLVESDFWGAVEAGIIDADGNLPTDSDGNELDPDGNVIDPSASGGKGKK